MIIRQLRATRRITWGFYDRGFRLRLRRCTNCHNWWAFVKPPDEFYCRRCTWGDLRPENQPKNWPP